MHPIISLLSVYSCCQSQVSFTSISKQKDVTLLHLTTRTAVRNMVPKVSVGPYLHSPNIIEVVVAEVGNQTLLPIKNGC